MKDVAMFPMREYFDHALRKALRDRLGREPTDLEVRSEIRRLDSMRSDFSPAVKVIC